jgi:putative intracellular protease/amidase
METKSPYNSPSAALRAERSRVLIVVTSHDQLGTTGRKTGYYLPEVSHPAQALVEAGYDIDFVSPQGGHAPLDPASSGTEDPSNRWFLENKALSGKLERTLRPDEVRAGDYAGIFYAGGHGTMWDFRSSPLLNQTAALIYDNGGAVAAVCHGPAGLVDVVLANGKPLVQGKKVAAFSNDEEVAAGVDKVVPFLLENALVEKGGSYSKAGLWQSHVVIDGRLVTGQNPASAAGVGRALAMVLKG